MKTHMLSIKQLRAAWGRSSAGLGLLLALFNGALGTMAAPIVKEVTLVQIQSTELEALAVTKDGTYIVGGSPIVMPEGGQEVEAYHSEMPLLLHDPTLTDAFVELPKIHLGSGEITDVAIAPDRSFLVAGIRDDDLHQRNVIMLIGAHGATVRMNLPNSADGFALSPDGRYVVVAGEKYEAIDVLEVVSSTAGPPLRLELAARIGLEDFLPFFEGEEARLENEDLEPESVTFNPDGSLAFVSLQEQSSIAVVDMSTLALVNVVHLPYGFLVDLSEAGDGSELGVFGVAPDGISVTPDGAFLIAANESDRDAPHLQSVSVIDLRQGPLSIPDPVTYCIFDLDPSLLNGTGLASCPLLSPGAAPTAEETAMIRSLPRLDPNNTQSVLRQGRTITAVNIERKPKDQDRGSVLFLDASGLANEGHPSTLERVLVGVHKNARPEALKSSNDGRFIWVGLQNDGGSFARIELEE